MPVYTLELKGYEILHQFEEIAECLALVLVIY
jgi:hypothetical protein